MSKQKKIRYAIAAAIALCAAAFILFARAQKTAKYDTSYAMSTVITQTAYGVNAEKAMQQVALALQEYENRLSLFNENSEIAKINAGAGTPVAVSADTWELVRRSLALSATSEGAFDLTIAPLTLLWGITTDHPAVPAKGDIAAALTLVDDSAVVLEESAHTVQLAAGQGLDLGGIAKGNACAVAQKVYEKYGVSSAVLSIGGNVYIRGKNPDGSRFKVGFRDPTGSENSYIAALEMEDQVMAVSGGYERYFEQDGVRYCHILNGRTGWPVESDILSVGAISADGTVADFMSTTLYVWGAEKTRAYMKENPDMLIVMLDQDGRLFVSAGLQGNFELTADAAAQYSVTYL